MSYRILTFCSLALVVAVTTSAWITRTAPPVARIPKLKCLETVELGEREYGEIAVANFEVANHGTGALLLSGFRTSCSCAGVEADDGGSHKAVQQIQLAPGATRVLRARMSVGSKPGTPQVVAIHFQTNDPDKPEASVRLVVPRVKGLLYSDPQAVVFGELDIGERLSRIIIVYDNGVAGRRIASVRSIAPEHFSAKLLPHRELPSHPTAGQAIAELEVTAIAARAGLLSGHIEVRLETAEPKNAPVLIPVSGEVVAGFSCRPSTFLLPRDPAARAGWSATAIIRGRGQQAIQAALVNVPKRLRASISDIPDQPDKKLLRLRTSDVNEPDASDEYHVAVRVGSADPRTTALLEITIHQPK